MSGSNGKLDLDAMLRSWPAPACDEAAWEQRAENIVRAALAATGSGSSAAALFDAPALAAEQGEPDASVISAGEKRMFQESDQNSPSQPSQSDDSAGAPASAVPSTGAPKPSERKRGSLKEMAARASQAGVSRPGLSGPPSSSAAAPRSSAAPAAPVSSAAVSAKPSDAGLEDSGIIHLNTVKPSAAPDQKEAAANDSGVEGEEKPAKAAAAAKGGAGPKKAKAGGSAAVAAAPAAKAEEKKSSSGMMAGIAIAVVGLAAAFAIMQSRKQEQPTVTPTAAQTAPAATEQAKAAPAPSDQPDAVKTAEPLAANALENAGSTETASGSGDKEKAAGAATGTGAVAAATGAPSGQPSAPEKAGDDPYAPSAPAATGTGKPGDLSSAMAAAVGEQAKKDGPSSDNAEPAAASRNQNIPEQPSQGSVAAAMGAVMPSAKGCVAGADDVSRAQVTFASNGTVKSVSVTGWAASHGATGCVKGALSAAKVAPFSKPSFTVGVTIRP